MNTFPWKCAVAAVIGLTAFACSAEKPPQPVVEVASSKGPGTGSVEQATTVTAKVQAINHSTRMVTLALPNGHSETLHAGPEVRNLAQVKKGDLVNIDYYEAIAYEVKKKGTAKPSMDEATAVTRAPVGARPAAGASNVTTVTATIKSIDKTTNTVELKGPKGKVVSVKVKDPSRLEGVKVGDLVEITYTEAIAVSVDEASSR